MGERTGQGGELNNKINRQVRVACNKANREIIDSCRVPLLTSCPFLVKYSVIIRNDILSR